jgi:hypothetical protein
MQRGERMAAVEKIKESASPQIFSGTATGRSKRKAFVRYHTKQGVERGSLRPTRNDYATGGRAKQTRSVCEITKRSKKRYSKKKSSKS